VDALPFLPPKISFISLQPSLLVQKSAIDYLPSSLTVLYAPETNLDQTQFDRLPATLTKLHLSCLHNHGRIRCHISLL
jgi:hypothetical protein